ncbi:MAG: SIS domain-containing protein [Eubacteriales bacterium]|nr:SIS domain-containing protein [Eubacteriales bacterium]
MTIEEKLNLAVDRIGSSFQAGGKLLLCGNGGSAADCAHITGELCKGFLKKRPLSDTLRAAIGAPWAAQLQQALPVVDLTANSALIAAIVNDLDGGNMFAQQVMAYGKPGDVLLGISTSGNAENVCRAVQCAKALGLYTIALTGQSGGRLSGMADLLLNVEAQETYRVQELHLPLYHQLCMRLEASFFKD